MQNRKLLLAPRIVSALRLEPSGMFEEGVPIPDDPKSLQEFAVAFTPIFAAYLAMDNAYEATFENFKNRPHWFARAEAHGRLELGDELT